MVFVLAWMAVLALLVEFDVDVHVGLDVECDVVGDVYLFMLTVMYALLLIWM